MAAEARQIINDEEINDIVLEYLQLNCFDESARIFREEVAERKKRLLDHSVGNEINAEKEELLRLYDEGKRDDFFKKLSNVDSNEDEHYMKLEFSLQLYFVVHDLMRRSTGDVDAINATASVDDDNVMQKFKLYLKTRGSTLANDPDFLPYFALPYISNPSQHFSFKDLFQESWVRGLRQRLDNYLSDSFKDSATATTAVTTSDVTPEPKLVRMYNDSQVKRSSAGEEISAQLQLERQKLLRLQDNYQKLMHITTELLSALEASVKGDEINLSQVMDNCLEAFPELFAGGSDVDVEARDNIIGSLRSYNNNNSSSSNNNSHRATPRSSIAAVEAERSSTPLLRSKTQAMLLVSLDYKSIKRDLIECPPRLKMFILQALRWRLTQSHAGEQRQSVLASYVAYDVLGTEGGEYGDAIVVLVTSQTVELRQSMARLLNAFASLTAGRSYLAANGGGSNRLLHALMDNVRYNKPEAVTLDMSLSTLQKLSLRRQLQSAMINGDLIEYLVSVLEDDDALSDYALEYTVALLMNLCLRTAGKERCTRCSRRVLNILNNLLGNQNPEIIPYVNGTLYSLLTVSKIKREALSMGLEDMLNCYMEDSAPEMRRQLEFILKQLASDDPVEETTSDYEDEDDDDEEQDVLEDELDKDDVVLVIPGELQGEDLLAANYSLHASKQRQKEKQKQDEMLLTRPATPRVQPASAVRRRSSVQAWTGQQQSSSPNEVPSERPSDKQLSTEQPTSQRRTSISQQVQFRTQTPVATSNLNVDQYASRVLNEVVGIEMPVTEAVGFPPVLPREPEKQGGTSVNEYVVAFSSRPKIPRTPEHSGRRSQSPYFDRSSFRDGL